MQAIIIGAGRGQRLMPTTADTPKCFAEVAGRRILDWTLAALRANGIDRVWYIGVAKFSAAGAARLRAHYHRCRAAFAGKPFHRARAFEKAYLIQLFQDMIEAGEAFAHVDTPGGYIEIDTQQDFDYARRHWNP